MDYRRFENTIVARIDCGEEVLEQVKVIAQKENIKLAHMNALGAVNDITVGVFITKDKQYKANRFQGDFEIVSLTGTISTMGGEYYAHLHMSVGDENGHVFGGHLNRGIISVTCEMIIQIIDGAVERKYDEEIGLNLFHFQ